MFDAVRIERESANVADEVLQEDVVFSSPTGPAVFALGCSANGWTAWKTDNGEAIGIKLELINASCADQTVDVVVNAANDGLWAGGGICGVIFSKAGRAELTEACSKYKTPLNDGDAVITPAFKMTNAKAIIHAVGPNFAVAPTAFKELFDAYYNSLVVLKDNGYHSISFPLISSGIFGGSLDNPVAESTKQCLRAYKKFTADHPEYEIDVKLCAFTASEMREAEDEYEAFKQAN